MKKWHLSQANCMFLDWKFHFPTHAHRKESCEDLSQPVHSPQNQDGFPCAYRCAEWCQYGWVSQFTFTCLILTIYCQANISGGIVTHEPRALVFTNAGLLNFIIKLIICEDEVSKILYCTCIMLTCLYTSRHSNWLSMVRSDTCSGSASQWFLRRTFHIARLFMQRYFGMHKSQRKESVQVWAGPWGRFHSLSMHGPSRRVTRIYHSLHIIYIYLLINWMHGSWSWNSYCSRRFMEGTLVQTWQQSWARRWTGTDYMARCDLHHI